MSAPDLQSAEIRVTERLRAHRKARAAFIAARTLLLEAIAERDTMRGNTDTDGQAMTCEHGHVACAVGMPNYCGDEHQ